MDHTEYAGRLQFYEETDDITGGWLAAQMHGSAVASIAVGRAVGVAPEADLYYIASALCGTGTPVRVDFACLADSVERVLAVNSLLPEGRKIRVLSMSIGWSQDDPGYAAIQAAAEDARAAGLLVVCSSIEAIHGVRFDGLGRGPLSDPDDPHSYLPGIWWAPAFYGGEAREGALLVPMDARATASPGGPDEYVFYRSGGWSWSIPYLAGMYALAAQVRPEVTPDLFWRTAMRTGTHIQVTHGAGTQGLGPILNPAALIAALLAP